MIAIRTTLLAALGLVTVFASAEVAARRVIIDQGQFIDTGTSIDACTIGVAGCTAVTLPFSFDFGTGLTDQAFVYDRGIISFGQEIPTGVDANADFTTFGVPVIAPLYVPGNTGTAGPYDAFTGTFTNMPGIGPNPFIISFLDPTLFDPSSTVNPYVNVILEPLAAGLRFEFIHGQSFLSGGILEVALPNTTGTQLGYSLGDPLNPQQVLNDPADIVGTNAFTYPAQPSGIPEPGTWAMITIGFGAAGLAVRRAKRRSLRYA